jgi:hypothetical protein
METMVLKFSITFSKLLSMLHLLYENVSRRPVYLGYGRGDRVPCALPG